VLDADHAGLDDVKQRITEYLAVRKLRAERGLTDDRRSGAILTLNRPAGNRQDVDWRVHRPGHRPASSSACRSAACAMKRIRGHRRTYIGALPGRLVRALRDAGTMNPVILLDEVDKLGADWRGDRPRPCSRCSTPHRTMRFRITTSMSRSICRTCCSSRPRTWPIRFPDRCSIAWK